MCSSIFHSVKKPTVVKPKTSKKNADGNLGTRTISFESASDIRNYIYQEWTEQKTKSTKQILSERRRKEKEEQAKKEKVIMYT